MVEKNAGQSIRGNLFIKHLTLFFGVFLLFTDVFFLGMGIHYDLPLIRYLIYVKLVVNSTNIYLILKRHYLISTLIIYTVIMAMMIVGVISLGTAPAFQLYALGMLSCISYNGYLHRRVLKKELPMAVMMVLHVVCYSVVYLYARSHEPLYVIPRTAEDILIVFNSVASFSIVLLYVCLFYHVAITSEEKLEKMAMVDNLTGLYNRHYLLAFMENLAGTDRSRSWLALLDIDNFKKVNDTYGHNCGDYILHRIAEMTQQICKDSVVCRWGGEEFVILSNGEKDSKKVLEQLRKKIADEEFCFEEQILRITVTIGVADYVGERSNDLWISAADEKLYYGKNNGKNRVVE
ncbi:MAG: diguanylate cyclase [Lachnospiraceae bacterium]|nr:diguanylate cyclase [Lachnospiraceae bacterium]